MDQSEQITAFCEDIEKVIDRYRAEFDLTLAACIGSLEIIKTSLIHTSLTESDDQAS